MEVMLVPLALLFLAGPILSIVATVWAARLDRRLRDLEVELLALRRAAPAAHAAPPPPREAPIAPMRAPETPAPRPLGAAEAPIFASLEPPAAELPPRDSGSAFEMMIGTRWLNVAGIVTLLFGVAFFLKYAYDSAWIGPRGRVAIGVASGLVAILMGEGTRRRGHRVFSQGLAGGGLAALYLSFFFAFRFYSLIEIAPAFVLMAAVTACGVALALLQDSLAVAVLSFVGAYITPVLLSTGQDSAEFLFTYLAILALGALGVTYFKRWRALDILAFAGTALLYAAWYGTHYSPPRFPVAFLGLGTFFFIFLLVPYGHNLARRVLAEPPDHALSVANATFTFGYLYRMLYHVSPSALGFIALGLSGCYLGLGALARRRLPEDRGLAISILSFSIAFLTLAIPLQLGLHGITLAWAAEGLLILYLGFRYQAFLTRAGGLFVMALSILRLFVKHTPLHTQPFTFIWNPTFGTWVLVTAAVFGAAWLYRREAGRVGDDEASLPSVTLVAGALLLLAGLNLETWSFFTIWSRPMDELAGAMMILWAVFPVAAYLAGHIIEDRALKTTATVLTLVSAIPFLRLTASVMAGPDPLFGSFVFWMGVLGVVSFFVLSGLHRRHGGLVMGSQSIHRLLAAVGTGLLFVLLTAEVYSHYRLLPGTPEQVASNHFRALLAVSVLWALFASALMALGFAQGERAARYAAFGLFGLTLLKAFVLDMSELQTIYRIVSFLILGLLLVVASFVYSRFRSRIAMVVLCCAVGLVAGGVVRADFDPPHWRFLREIDAGPSDSGPSLVWIALDEEVLKESRSDLADLRVIGRDRQEVPCVVSARRGGVRETTWTPRILNRATLPGGAARADLEFEGKQTRNSLRVETKGESFRRRVMVEGSDDGAAWAALVDSAWIYDVPAAGAAGGARLDEVTLPDNDYRRLRVTVFPMPDERQPLVLTAATARRLTTIPPETMPLRVTFAVSTDPKTKTTAIDLDFGYRNARPLGVSLDLEETAFRRSYRAYGRPEEKMIVKRGRTESGDPIESEIEAPWQPLGSGFFFRMPRGGAGETAIDRTAVVLQGGAARYLRLILEDHDNRPLRLRGATAAALVHRLVFPVRPGGAYALYYGNPDAAPPTYDLPSLLPDLDAKPPATARLGPVAPNTLRLAGPELPFSERHPWTLWAVLLAAVALLSLIVLRNARAIPNGS